MLGDGRRRARAEARDRPNALERVMDLARAAGDDDKLVRALARDVVWYASDGGTADDAPGPTLVTVAPEDVDAPVARGHDGRPYLLVFSSRAALVAHHGAAERRRHVQAPAGELFRLLPDDHPVLVNPSGPRLLVLEPEAVRTVVELFHGRDLPAAFLPGPASGLLLAPLEDADRGLSEGLTAAARHVHAITGLWAGRAVLDEPGARSFVVVTAQVPADIDHVDLDGAMRALVAAAEAATRQFAWVRPVRGEHADEVLAWLRQHTPQLARA